jgi:hypothetical protein
MPRHDKVKINGANGQTGGKHRSSTFVLSAFISFGLLIFSVTKDGLLKLCQVKAAWTQVPSPS